MKRLLTVSAMLMATTGLASAEGVLQLYNWGNYTSPELLEKFKAETGITVTVTDYDSNDVALAKIEAGGHGFDLVVPSANYVQIFSDKGLTVPLDLSKLPSHGNIAPEWKDVPWDPGRANSIRGSGARWASPWIPRSIRAISTPAPSGWKCPMS